MGHFSGHRDRDFSHPHSLSRYGSAHEYATGRAYSAFQLGLLRHAAHRVSTKAFDTAATGGRILASLQRLLSLESYCSRRFGKIHVVRPFTPFWVRCGLEKIRTFVGL